jgi:hypothetical protein
MPKREHYLSGVVLLILSVTAGWLPAMAQGTRGGAGAIEPGAGNWKPWVLASGQELKLPPPPDSQATAAELQELKTLAGQRDVASLERIRYWDFWSPSYRWNEILTDIGVRDTMGTPPGIRAFALMNVAINDALIAAWNAKFAHNRKRPSEIDYQLITAVSVPRSPSYPCEHSVAAGAAAMVLSQLFPRDGERINRAAEEASRSRVVAGAVFPSDAKAGLELGRMVAARVIEFAKIDGTRWAGTIPVGAGLWQGTNPIGIDDVRWKTFVLTSGSQFRPGPPPAPDSPQRAQEVAEVRNFKRTPLTNAKAMYWQFGQYASPLFSYRLSEETGRQLAETGLEGNAPRSARAYALVHVAHYDAYVASQDAKFHYWTARPNQFDPTITTVVPNPPFPSYPSNAAVLYMGPALVLGHLFPREAERYRGWVKEFGESRLWAGIHFRSDLDAGWEMGRRIGSAVIERARRDGAE